ncbi:unnamed protein product [Soboliphyme baturini]|uniref:CNH domain-containing protein n=1 Tax=Soboliphyme baturini TaxID=241478 RepID=A0A183J0E7_9BILA|nr:unnamed protein product [Soboliphyme baturini]
MTLVYGEASDGHLCRSRLRDLRLTMHTRTGQLLFYDKKSDDDHFHQVPATLRLEHKDEMTVFTELLDANVTLCSPQVPQLFSDNFDFLTLDDLIREVLINEEILGNKVHVYLMKHGYVSFVRDFHTYLVTSVNVLERWSYPIVPDRLLRVSTDKETLVASYVWKKKNVYYGVGFSAAGIAGCVLSECIVRSHARLSEGVTVRSRCVVGEYVNLQEGATLTEGSFLVMRRSVDDDLEYAETVGLSSNPDYPLFLLTVAHARIEENGYIWPPWTPLSWHAIASSSSSGKESEQESGDEEVRIVECTSNQFHISDASVDKDKQS